MNDIQKSSDPIYEMLAKYKPAIQSVLPQFLKPERMLRIAHTIIHRNPKLKSCTPVSLINAVVDISIKGLEIGSTAHIIPFKNVATVIFDYKGLIELAYRSGMINNFPFKAVYANDFFEYEEGTARFIKHRPAHENRGELIAAYAIVNFKGGGFDIEVVHKADINAVKRVAPGAKSSDSPWNKPDQEWTMWCKTAVRRLAKRIPQSPELQNAVVMEEKVESGLKQDLDHIISDETEKIGAIEVPPAQNGDHSQSKQKVLQKLKTRENGFVARTPDKEQPRGLDKMIRDQEALDLKQPFPEPTNPFLDDNNWKNFRVGKDGLSIWAYKSGPRWWDDTPIEVQQAFCEKWGKTYPDQPWPEWMHLPADEPSDTTQREQTLPISQNARLKSIFPDEWEQARRELDFSSSPASLSDGAIDLWNAKISEILNLKESK